MSGLSVRNLSVAVTGAAIELVRSVDLDVQPGEILGVVGESGSGKTTLGLALLGYARRGLHIASGTVWVGGTNVTALSGHALRAARGGLVSYVSQDPATALNPALTIGRQLVETLEAHDDGASADERKARVRETLRDVLLPEDPSFLARYPHQLSGGQQQRVVLAIAIACRPAVIVLDEPATGLDVATQAHVIATVRDLARSHRIAAIYVTHDLAVVSSLADRVAVMYAGSLVEEGPAAAIFDAPGHPYTERLIAAVPHLDGSVQMRGIPGQAPSPARRPDGCAFEPRCSLAVSVCRAAPPELHDVGPGHRVRCIRSDDVRRDLYPVPAQAKRGSAPSAPLLEITGLDAWYGETHVLRSIDFSIDSGECVALVGESGSGKTTLARVVVGLHCDYAGDLVFDGASLAPSVRDRPQEVRQRVQYVFQNPYSSLNPRFTVGETVGRPLLVAGLARSTIRRRVSETLELVSLTADYVDRYPDEISGGQRQRVAIARALIADPDLLICDEVTSALDVSVQATILDLLMRLQRELDLSLLFVTHNLPLVRSIASRAVVLRAGTVVEAGSAAALLDEPASEYTKTLIANTPALRL